jgi:hypothetical protein
LWIQFGNINWLCLKLRPLAMAISQILVNCKTYLSDWNSGPMAAAGAAGQDARAIQNVSITTMAARHGEVL